jgi:hypothetical protein
MPSQQYTITNPVNSVEKVTNDLTIAADHYRDTVGKVSSYL